MSYTYCTMFSGLDKMNLKYLYFQLLKVVAVFSDVHLVCRGLCLFKVLFGIYSNLWVKSEAINVWMCQYWPINHLSAWDATSLQALCCFHEELKGICVKLPFFPVPHCFRVALKKKNSVALPVKVRGNEMKRPDIKRTVICNLAVGLCICCFSVFPYENMWYWSILIIVISCRSTLSISQNHPPAFLIGNTGQVASCGRGDQMG